MCYSLDVDTCDSNDTMLYAAPISHGAGLYMLVAIRSAAKNLIPESRGFDEDEIISLARSQGNLVFFAAPTMVKRLVARANIVNFDGSGIRTIIYGGGPMYAADIDEALTLFGPKFVQIYGQGESPMTISVLSRDLVADTEHSRWRVRRSSVGIPHACVSLRILDADGNACPVGDTGEIAVHSPTVMQAYWRNPEATAETIQDGWLMTGDLGHMDEDGFLFLTDRSKDVIISGGTNIYPREVEEVLLRHPAIFEAAVIGKAEPHWGEQVVAFVVLRDEYECTSADLDSFCQAEIAAFKRPKKYLFVSSLPKNNYGKILKHELSKICQNQI
jgi:acyl-CoA synthetase (AMP-forming)/AMP-acid ligase II